MGTASVRVVVTHGLDHAAKEAQVSQHLVERFEVSIAYPSSCRPSSHLKEKSEPEHSITTASSTSSSSLTHGERERQTDRQTERQREGERERERDRDRDRERETETQRETQRERQRKYV